MWVKNRSQISDSYWAETITYFDGLGRAYKTEEVNSDGNVFVEKQFDADGRVLRVSNPYRAGETVKWTTNVYDNASRVISVTLPDGSSVGTEYSVSTSTPIGVTKQITDQASKKRKGFTDVLGNMVRVVEDPTGQNLSTDYVFDVLGSLRKATQGEQTRYFMHDSLGRLLFDRQPEQDVNGSLVGTDSVTGNSSWTAKYVYDDNGNLNSTTDARNQETTATYDRLNRLQVRNYVTDTAMPDVSFYYDGKGLPSVPDFSKGKTTKVMSSASENRYLTFDVFGRVLSHRQTTDGTDYDMGYTYNLAGVMIEQTYPSGRKVKNTFDENGDLAQVQSKKTANHGYFAYADAFAYNTAGSLTKMQLGNGRWETFLYNERQQIKQIGLGNTSALQDVLKLEYTYNTTGQTDNNGSPREQKITVPTVGSYSGFTATQTYSYDGLNRLTAAEEKIGGTMSWKQTFTIDRYGNRRYDEANTTTLGSCTSANCNPTISTTTNRLTTAGYTFDANGNLTANSAGERFTYDAENHQKGFFSSSNAGGTPDSTYIYDGDGKRVKKIAPLETTVFVYDATGKVVAEYSTATSPATPQVSYLTQDHLGSQRIVTNENGVVTDRKDFTAFGEEVLTAQRTATLKYTSEPEPRKDYTSYEKDVENGLQFAQARYYNSTHGRFTSVDPLTASATIRDPQSFNRYSYVLNSPYRFTDTLGLLPESIACGSRCANSGPSVDGSAFRGKDTTFAHLVTISEQVAQFMAWLRAGTIALNIAEMSRQSGAGMSRSEIWLARAFGAPGTYFSNPNDGDPVDQTVGFARNSPDARRDAENHMYGSATDPAARTDFFIPEGGKFIMQGTYKESEGGTSSYALLYFSRLGALRNVTVAVFHMTNIDPNRPVGADGRRKLGEMGAERGGGWTFRVRDLRGNFIKSSASFHYHLEIYRGYKSRLPGKPKPHYNFNGVVP